MQELPFMATENILMYCVKRGGDRQTLHEAIRKHSVDTAKAIKEQGADNDLFDRIADDPIFNLNRTEIDSFVNVHAFTGRAAEQTDEYLSIVNSVLAENQATLDCKADAAVLV